ncbi:hypothetical protein FEM33_17225 [Dyadobacter flavalbus]|uniref:Uncharacterized protein n=1 Tax=Dyadobacter flavalbus TaxID=2579942 RepID=A0A5M8QQS4_9BACT|nr:hypothetical protein [Dyadobacter flavalbus]KAA6438429.1 hypothetical protein FEM33_17225 [Dyadobacter flavalbus]
MQKYCATSGVRADTLLKTIRKDPGGLLAGHLDPILELAQSIPAYSGNFLEWHLGKTTGVLDYIYRINTIYDTPLLSFDPLPGGQDAVISRGYRKLVNDARTQFRYGIENVFFEYDFPVLNDPAVFFDLHKRTGIRADAKRHDLLEVCSLFEYPLSEAFSEMLARLDAHDFNAIHFGLMFSRAAKAVRMTIDNVQGGRLTEALKLLGWQGDFGIVSGILDNFSRSTERMLLSVDYGGLCSQRIGIEMLGAGMHRIVPDLAASGMITGQQQELLLKWSGRTLLEPSDARQLSELHQRQVTHLYRRINHFKFIVDGSDVSVKAYLYYCF